jgi:putative ABC transport system permease protein
MVPRVLAFLRRPSQLARLIDEELTLHLEFTTEDLIAEGMKPSEARLEARRRLGDYQTHQQACATEGRRQRRANRRNQIMHHLLQDFTFALRSSRKRPGFAVVAIVTLALGIGATTTMFSVMDRVVLRPLPFADADQLLVVGTIRPGRTRAGSMSPLNFYDVRQQNDVFSYLAASRGESVTLPRPSGGVTQLNAHGVSWDFFELLGTRPMLGRTFVAADDEPGAAPVAVLGHGTWQRRFGGDPAIVGRTITLNQRPVTVVGVLDPRFVPPEALYQAETELWFPLVQLNDDLTTRSNSFLQAIGRLRPDVTMDDARQRLDGLALGLAEAYPDVNRNREGEAYRIGMAPLKGATIGNIGDTLTILLGAVGFLLLIACANVASLVLARATARERELAVRAALGAGRGRIIRQLLTENLLLALMGGGLGVALAYGGVAMFRTYSPGSLPRMAEVAVDVRILAFALGLSLLTGMFFGLIPALFTSRRDTNASLKEGAADASGGRGRHRLLGGLVFAETVLALMLVSGAGLLINSFVRLNQVETGWVTERLMTMQTYVGYSDRYTEPEPRAEFFRQVIERLHAIPGVSAVGATDNMPLDGNQSGVFVTVEGSPTAETEAAEASIHTVTPGYFAAMGMPVLQGRSFTQADDADAPRVVIVNRAFATEHFPNGGALGGMIRFGRDLSRPPFTVVGVVGDVTQQALATSKAAEIYYSFYRGPRVNMRFAVRTELPAATVAQGMSEAVWAVDPEIPITNLLTMEERVSQSLATPRFYMIVLGTFAAVALVLAAVGLYGVVSFSVGQRVREMGVRVALGASAGSILRLVLRQSLGITVAGVVVGLVGAVAASRVLRSLLFGIAPGDPVTLTVVALVMLVVATVAVLVPAVRATRVDPIQTLRAE